MRFYRKVDKNTPRPLNEGRARSIRQRPLCLLLAARRVPPPYMTATLLWTANTMILLLTVCDFPVFKKDTKKGQLKRFMCGRYKNSRATYLCYSR